MEECESILRDPIGGVRRAIPVAVAVAIPVTAEPGGVVAVAVPPFGIRVGHRDVLALAEEVLARLA